MFKMEKRIQRQGSNLQFNKNVPGCFWTIFHTIDYHRWHNVKKRLPYKKHSRNKGGPKSTRNDHQVEKVSEQSNDGNDPLVCTAESCPIGRKPGEAHVNEVMAQEMSEEESQKFWKFNSSSKRRLIRTQSIHHIESSYYSPGYSDENGDNGITSRQKSPVKLAASGMRSVSLSAMDNEDYFIQRKIDIQLPSLTKKSNGVKKNLEANKINRNVSCRSFKTDAHIQEIFKANRKLFAELLQGAHSKNTLQTSQNKKSSASLAKSGSFPAPSSAQKGYRKLSSLRHKQSESYPKQKSNSPHPSKLVESKSPENFHEDMTPCDSDSTSHNIKHQTTPSSSGLNHGLRHGGWNQLVVKRFNFIKQKIRGSLKERKRGNHQKTSKGIPTVHSPGHELPFHEEEAQESKGTATRGHSETGNSENDNLSNGVQTKTAIASPNASLERYSQFADGSGIVGGYSETDNSGNDNLNNNVQTKTGTASLSASLERYSKLSEDGFDKNRDAKCNHSQSFRLISGEKIPNIEGPKKNFGRHLSFSGIDLFCALFTDPPHAVSRTKKPKRGLAHSSTYNNIRKDENPGHLLTAHVSTPLDSDSSSIIEEGDDNVPVDYSSSLNEVINDEGAAWVYEHKQKIAHPDISNGKHDQVSGSECIVEDVREVVDHVSDLSHINQVLELQTCFQDDETSDLSDSVGEILDPWCSIYELELSNGQPNEARTEVLPAYETTVSHEIIDDAQKKYFYLHLHSDCADFNYMRYILQLSSFIDSDHTIDQPLNSSIFEGEEACFYEKLECYWGKVDKDSDHQLLHDLVYETLHNMYETSFVSVLKTFSSMSQIRPMPLGQYLLEEVQEKIAWYLRLGPELDQCLDDVVGRDLNKGDDWMNLHPETEFIALDLEDMILDELLDEVISYKELFG
ncbi:uncharacterized protein LOC105435275 [Cucumis sativus]|uniref:uncharacterized protein LOC105435275 n=1 Tax=Cucumis sativus TaxID=3659 RepID=UPI0012F5085B|nr:uncharacterized protein LOC105435275 [Cucumis sativus]XP_011653966.2 uncharacterized protein LOC105435275 [Cucumis sativus]XP_031740652.1 uncharacterized protein LOC105435275 [Cucumis sativus]XP_031740653.1 uncharacterized protein LOC105435275 [Cucumis sativus]XP_031740654.1 uncharacterized protein LOC105435275 [Cucumis sativus]XP_031740655.1 uncharacterized protein LOC105435275 [Cucumis sativus]XP_031740656.1 uncharacterized protein LOC105435275 [Cucumis sativus]XP_031740657.1 uncharacte